MSQIRTYKFKVVAGGQHDLAVSGEFVHLTESSGELKIKGAGLNCILSQGQKARSSEFFKKLVIENNNTSDISGVITVGSGDFTDGRLSGNVSVQTAGSIVTYADKAISATSESTLLLAEPARKEVFIQSLASNSGSVRIGGTVGISQGVILKPDATLLLTVKGIVKAYNPNGSSVLLAVNEVIT